MARDPNPAPPAFREARVCACGDHGFVGLTRGLVALCSPEDVPMVAERKWTAFPKPGGAYASITIVSANGSQGTRLMHRLILGGGPHLTDHINGDRLDNRRCNLRPCTPSENMRNTRKRRDSQSSYKGIYPSKWGFYARIRLNGRQQSLGHFGSQEEAARVYDAAALQHFGEFARTNASMGLLPAPGERETPLGHVALRQWMDRVGLDDLTVTFLLGTDRDRRVLSSVLERGRVPSPKIARVIEHYSKGAVPASSWAVPAREVAA